MTTRSCGPLVSVILPTYNRLDYLKHAVASVLQQTYPRWELIIVDDGSSDGTREWLENIADHRVRALTIAHTGNVADVRNVGLSIARGDLIGFLDSDDVWLPEKLARQVKGIAEKTHAWSYTIMALIDAGGNEWTGRVTGYSGAGESGWILERIVTEIVSVTIVSVVLTRSVFEEIGDFDPELSGREDLDFLLRLARSAPAVAIDEVLVNVREHRNRTTKAIRNPYERTAAVWAKLEKSGSLEDSVLRAARRWRGYHLVRSARLRARDGSVFSALDDLIAGIIAWPGAIAGKPPGGRLS